MYTIILQSVNNSRESSDSSTWSTTFENRLFEQHENGKRHQSHGRQALLQGQRKLPSNAVFRNISDYSVWVRIHAAWWLASEDCALHKFGSFVKSALLNNGHPVPTSYKDDHTAWEIVQLLAKYFRRLLAARLQRSPFYGIMTDETTDNSTSQQLIIYIKFLDQTDQNEWIPKVEFLDLVSPTSGTAEDLKVINVE